MDLKFNNITLGVTQGLIQGLRYFKQPNDNGTSSEINTSPVPSKKVESSPKKKSGEEYLVKDILRVYENERWRDEIGWSHRNLELGDPSRYICDSFQSDNFDDPELQDGWEYHSEWYVEEIPGNEDGWVYASDFRAFDSLNGRRLSTKFQKLVRRKFWVRDIHQVHDVKDDFNTSDRDCQSDQASEQTPSVGGNDYVSDIEDEDDDEYLSFLNTGGLANIRDPELLAIGKRMRILEAECRKEEDLAQREWKRSILPGYKRATQELEAQMQILKNRMKMLAKSSNKTSSSNTSSGKSFSQQQGPPETKDNTEMKRLESELAAYMEAYESTKLKMYLPTSVYSTGGDGFYVGFDDIWLENISGQFVLDLVPSQTSPQVIILLTGTTTGSDSGVAIRIMMNGFKLRCDSGTGVPNLSFDTIKLTVVLRVTIMLTFNVAERKWTSNSHSFIFEVLSFRGPFGTRRSLVSTIISLVTPIIRNKLTAAIPPEIGLVLQQLPSPFSVRGEFDLRGIELIVLERNIYKYERLCYKMGYTQDQMLCFMAMQKSIDRGTMLTTLHDFLKYRRLGRSHHKLWDQLRLLWNQASILYFEKINDMNVNSDMYSDRAALTIPLSFEKLLQATEEVLKKPVTLDLTLHQLDCSISLMSILENCQRLFERWSTTKNSSDDGDTALLMYRISQQLEDAQTALLFITQNLSFVNCGIKIKLTTGANGELLVNVNDIQAKVPMSMWITTLFSSSFGFNSPVPFVCDLGLDEDGAVNIELFHVGSEAMLARTNYLLWREQKQAEESKGSQPQSISDEASALSQLESKLDIVDRGSNDDMFENNSFSSIPSNIESSNRLSMRESTSYGTNDLNSNSNSINTNVTPIAVNRSSDTKVFDMESKPLNTDANILQQQQEQEDSRFNPSQEQDVIDKSESDANSISIDSSPQLQVVTANIVMTKDSRQDNQIATTLTADRSGTKDISDEQNIQLTMDNTKTSEVTKPEASNVVVAPRTTIRAKIRQSILGALRRDSSSNIAIIEDNESLPQLNKSPSKISSQTSAPSPATQPMSKLSTKLESYVGLADRQKRDLKRTIDIKPHPRGGHTVGLVRIFEPQVSIVVDDLVTLQKGTQLLSFSLSGNRTKSEDVNADVSGASNGIGDGIVGNADDTSKSTIAKSKTNKQAVEQKGCKIHLQTAQLIKLHASIPKINITISLPSLIRFLNMFLSDFDSLRDFIGVTTELGRDVVDEHMHIFKVLVDRLSKYLLVPNVELDLNLFGKIEATENDLIVSFQSLENQNNSKWNKNSSNSSNSSIPSNGNDASSVLHLNMRGNIMDVVADVLTIKVAAQRCERALSLYIAQGRTFQSDSDKD